MSNEILIYQQDGRDIEVQFNSDQETIWLSQTQIADVFGTKRPAITKHLSNIFKSGELDETVVCSILEHTTAHGAIAGKFQVNKVKHYNLDAIISVGYRVNSSLATQFRQWATKRLREHLTQGYTLNNYQGHSSPEISLLFW